MKLIPVRRAEWLVFSPGRIQRVGAPAPRKFIVEHTFTRMNRDKLARGGYVASVLRVIDALPVASRRGAKFYRLITILLNV